MIEPVRTLTKLIFFLNDEATAQIYTLSLHDALPIWSRARCSSRRSRPVPWRSTAPGSRSRRRARARSEEHTSELQSHSDLVCRLLLEKKTNRMDFTAASVAQFAP